MLFQIATLKVEGRRLFVCGRNCEANLTLGDCFTAARSGESVAVNLRVEGILAYRRYLNILDAGMTAELELSGTGLDAVAPDAALTGDSVEPLPASYELLGLEKKTPRHEEQK